ncbi:MAG: hypothetical protein ABEI57_00675, partial [Halapricum sp.]
MTLTATPSLLGIDIFQVAVEVRAALALVLFLIVANWTWDRIMERGEDPTLTTSSFSGLGGLSVLITGVHAVAVVCGLAVYLLWPTFAANPELLFIPLALVLAHYYYEDAERRGGLFYDD